MSKGFRNILYILLLAGSFFIFGGSVRAAQTGDVVINEIAWMGSGVESTGANNEWIELYNNTDSNIELTGWKLVARDGKPDIALIEGVINAKSYFLIERTDDDSVPSVSADLIVSFGTGLGNKGEVLELYNQDGFLIDVTPEIIDETWCAGDNAEKLTMERIVVSLSGADSTNWKNSLNSGGTPRAENSKSASAGSGDGGGGGEGGEGTEGGESGEGGNAGEFKNPAAGSSESENAAEAEEGESVKLKIKSEKLEEGKEGKDGKEVETEKNNVLKKASILPGKIIINEIFPNPKGADFRDEFIELKNIGGQEVNITNWTIKNNDNQYVIAKADFPILIIPVGGFFILSRAKTNIALNNSVDKIDIFSEVGKKIDSISYKEYGKENISYAKIDGVLQWTAAISAGVDNIFIQPNRAPQSVIDAEGKKEIFSGSEIIFDASDSFDPDGDKLSYFWKSSDGKEAQDSFFKEKFNSSGEYKVSLKVSDSYNNENISEFKIKVLDNFFDKSLPKAVAENQSAPIVYKNNEWGNVIISEIMPNPTGDETTGEWIKLFNYENYPVSLADWVLDDKDGGSSPYYIPSDVVIQANSFFVFESGKTGIALNNDGDEARLLDPSGNIVSDVKYDKSYDGKVFSYDEETGNWAWGDDTHLIPLNRGIGLNTPLPPLKGGTIEDGSWNLESYEGEQISIEGYVSAKPGNLGVQVFYLTNGAKGIEVYCYKKDFPDLEVGDYISVVGIASDKDGWRLTINGQEDIKIVSYEHPPLAKELTGSDFSKDDLHNLVSIKGEVLEKQGNNLYIYFSEKEARVFINEYTGISLKDIPVGAQIQVIGILDYLNDDFRILPRSQEDLQQIENGRVLGKVAECSGQDGECSVASSSVEKNSTDLPDASEKRTKIILGLSASLISFAVIGLIVWRRSR